MPSPTDPSSVNPGDSSSQDAQKNGASGSKRSSGRSDPSKSSSADGKSGSGRKRKRNSGVYRAAANQTKKHRAALGLSEVKPSEMVKGLQQAADRAGGRADRQNKRRAAGGRINMVEALQVDDTGKIWSRTFLKYALGVLAFIVLASSLMYWISNRKSVDPKIAKAETQNRLKRYGMLYVNRLTPFDVDEEVTVSSFKEAMQSFLEQEVDELEEAIKDERTSRGQVSSSLRRKLARAQKDSKLEDDWGSPLIFSIEGDRKVEIRSVHGSVKKITFSIPRKKK